jgi:hypothetical protein
VSTYSDHSDTALRRAHVEHLEKWRSLHAEYIKLKNRGDDFRRVMGQAKGHFNEMIDIEQEARSRGISLSH